MKAEYFVDPVTPEFGIPYHTQFMECMDGVDIDAVDCVSGSGFYYLMGDVAKLHSSVLAYVRDLRSTRASE